MAKILDTIKAHRRLVGRIEELGIMRRILLEETDWFMVHLFGPAGMGKTALLQHFARVSDGTIVLHIDSSTGFEHPDAFLNSLRQLQIGWPETNLPAALNSDPTERLNYIAETGGGRILLVLDGLGSSSWRPIDAWLRMEWLPSLSTHIRVCSAGRMPLAEWLTEEGWNDLIVQLPLKPLDKAHWVFYLEEGGIADPSTRDVIGRVCGGVPLLLSQAVQHYREEVLRQPGSLNTRQLTDSLSRTFFAGIGLADEDLRLLGVASILYKFDQELLEKMLGETLSTGLFQRFCRLPMIEPGTASGWKIIGSIRKLVRDDLKERLPGAYSTYKRNAARELDRRISDAENAGSRHTTGFRIGKLFLEDNDLIQSFVYSGDDSGLELRGARHTEMPLLMTMCEKCLLGIAPLLADQTQQHRCLSDLWEADSESVVVIVKQTQIKGVATPVHLNSATRDIFERNPITSKLLLHPDTADCDYFFWLQGVDPPMDPDTLGYIFRSLFLPRLSGNKVMVMTWQDDETVKAITLLGFKELPWANQSAEGLFFRFFLLDSRLEQEKKNQIGGKTADITMAKRFETAKSYLKHYHELDKYIRSLIINRENLSEMPERFADQFAQQIRETFIAEHIRLKAGTQLERTLALILQFTYLKKRNSHDQVAAMLNLSQATYYRQLKKLISLLADKLPPAVELYSNG